MEEGVAVITADMHFGISNPELSGLERLKLTNLRNVLSRFRHADLVIDLGDISDRRVLDYAILDELCHIYRVVPEKSPGCLVFATGNHDVVDGKYIPLSPFAEGTSVSGSGARIADGNGLCAGPFYVVGWNGRQLPRPAGETGCRFLAGHIRVKDWVHQSDPLGISLDDLAGLGYEAVFLGDYHTPQEVVRNGCRIYSIGTFGASSFKDVDITSGFLIVEWKKTLFHSFRFSFDDYPVFKKLTISSPDEICGIENTVVRITLTSDAPISRSVLQDVRETALAQRPFHVEVHGVTNQAGITVQPGPVDVQIGEAIAKWPEGARLLAEEFLRCK